MNQVVEKFHDIDPDVWCKILYMEYGQTVAKFYICDKEVVIDGSTEEFTGRRLVYGTQFEYIIIILGNTPQICIIQLNIFS